MSKAARDIKDLIGDLGKAITVARRLSRRLAVGELPRMAAALSFRTIFGLIPVIVLGVAVLGSFATPDQVRDSIEKLLDYSGLGEIAVGTAQLEPGDSGDLQEGTVVMGPLGPIWIQADAGQITVGPGAGLPAHTERLDEWITGLVNRVSGSSFGAIGLVGLSVLIFAAFVMMLEIERAFNQICNAGAGRRWSKRVPVYWSLLTLGTLGLIASFYVAERATGFIATLEGAGWLVSIVGYAVTVCISTLLLLLAYTAVPNTRVHLRPALGGAFIAAVLWEAGKWGFTIYSKNTSYVSFYGSVALLMVFLVWVNLTWLIVLFGLQISHAMQHFEQFKKESRGDVASQHAESIPVDPVRYVELAAEATRRYQARETIDPDEASEACALPRPLAAAMLTRLAKAGILHEVGGEDETYTLTGPPEQISLTELMTLGDTPRRTSGGVRGLIAARLNAAEGLTLGDLRADEGQSPAASPA
ncbi:MAG: YhjD/YihY/BrkB family envelope integrity protein [Planctomycetota bacterium]